MNRVVSVKLHAVESRRRISSHCLTNIDFRQYGRQMALTKGQTILVLNTGEERECRVAHVGSLQCSKWTVGIEFAEPEANFWKISFPTCTANLCYRRLTLVASARSSHSRAVEGQSNFWGLRGHGTTRALLRFLDARPELFA